LTFSKLPKFKGNSIERKDKQRTKEQKITKETPIVKTLKAHLTIELQLSSIVYERLYPNSLPIIKRKSLFFTELSSMNTQDERSGRMIEDKKMTPYYSLKGNNDRTLIFESRFESGNLRLAIKKSEEEYDLYLQNDVNTQGNNQWFFFKVQNTYKDSTVYFNIKNLVINFSDLRPNRLRMILCLTMA
jgi:hypothetical protein